MSNIEKFGIEKIYGLFFITIMFWALLSLLVINNFHDRQIQYGELINKSGKQRMLSQKILHHALLAAENNSDSFKKLQSDLAQMEENHHFLIAHIPSSSIRSIYYDAPYKVHEQTLNFLASIRINAETNNKSQIKNADLNDHFLNSLNHVVEMMQSEYEENFSQTLRLEMIIWILAISTITFEAFYLLLPAIKEIKKSKKKAEEASKAKDTFLTIMSHEIRTPLNGMIGFLTLLEKKENDPKTKQYLKVVFESAGKLEHIVNEILEYSKLSSEKFCLNNEPCNLKESIEATMKEFEAKAKEKKIEFLYHLSDVPVFISTDQSKIAQIMTHIIDNAIKFTAENGTVKAKTTYDPHTHLLRFAVKDNGIGISKHKIDLILEPFIQGDESFSRSYEGIGLGLTIIKEIVKGMNGTLEIESIENEGTTVIVQIVL